MNLVATSEATLHHERMEFIKDLALEAGRLTLEGFGRTGQMPKVGVDGYDIATVYDLRCEELVKNRILDEFDEPILGEEKGLIGDRETAKRAVWIVDPIDGTFNYQRGLPLYGVSIAYCRDGIPVCGAIYLPALDQLFYAAQGAGAFLAGGQASRPAPLHVARRQEITKLVIGFAGRHAYLLLAACASEGVPWRSIRYTMCAVVDLAYIAAGRMDAYCHPSLNLWDCAAADVLLREAGAPAPCDYAGVPIFPTYVHHRLDGDEGAFTFVAASSPTLFQEPLRRIISAAGFS